MDGSRTWTRRDVLAAGGVALSSLAGCTTVGGRQSAAVDVLSAGSLANTFETYVGPAFEKETGIPVHGEYYGTNAVMRMIEDGTKRPDVVVSADATLLRERLYGEFTDWDVEFASNSLGLGYGADTAFGRRLEAGEPWYELARETAEGDLAIGDPDLDPLGYRAAQAFELAEVEHDLDGFAETMLELVYEEPEEPQMMAGVETGSRAAAVVYRNMAVDHDMPFFEFPDAYNFANPEMAEQYASVSYTTDSGYTAHGRPILYNVTVADGADEPAAGRRLVQYLIDTPAILDEAGLTTGDPFPRPSGAVPEAIDV